MAPYAACGGRVSAAPLSARASPRRPSPRTARARGWSARPAGDEAWARRRGAGARGRDAAAEGETGAAAASPLPRPPPRAPRGRGRTPSPDEGPRVTQMPARESRSDSGPLQPRFESPLETPFPWHISLRQREMREECAPGGPGRRRRAARGLRGGEMAGRAAAGPAPLGTVVSCPTARAARFGTPAPNTPKPRRTPTNRGRQERSSGGPDLRSAPFTQLRAYWYWMYSGCGHRPSTSRGLISGSPFLVSLW